MQYYSSFDCVYESEGFYGTGPDDPNKTPFKEGLEHRACFGRTYSKIRQGNYSDVTYRLYLYAKDLPHKHFNLCTMAETKKILRCLQKVVPFSFKFEEADYNINNYDWEQTHYNVLVLHIQGNYLQHMWVTTMCRCFFEYPYNIIAKEACQLQSQYSDLDGIDMSKQNWINLYLSMAAQSGGDIGHGFVSRSFQPKCFSYKELKEKLANSVGKFSVRDCLVEKGRHSFSNAIPKVYIDGEAELNKGVESRAAKYVAAYKEKLQWKR